jgi:hypothetical protein
MMIKGKKGSALLQVLVLGSIIASVVILLLRFSITRTTNVVKTTRKLAAKAYAEGCLAKFTAETMLRELHGLPPLLSTGGPDDCPKFYTCSYKLGNNSGATEKNICFRPIAGGKYKDGGVEYTVPGTFDMATIDVTNSDQLL